jgi:aspartyl-tRNA(Asn)/glutamyl-tRNA(Gln) amidotransferase subunit A
LADALDALARVAAALGATATVELAASDVARAAAFCVTAAEGANLHLPDLRVRAGDYDPATRSRFLAGALLPGQYLLQAQRFRAWYRAQALELLQQYDVLLAPATPCIAPLVGQVFMKLGDREIPVRANLGLYTQPISFIGLPVVTVPVWLDGAELPIGVQIITAPWREALGLQVANYLELSGVVGYRAPA